MTLPGRTLHAGHWGVALGLALLLHAALALLAFQPAAPGALAGGRGGIQVGLGPAGGAAGAPSDVEPEEAPGVEAPLAEAQEALPPQAETLPPETLPPEAVQEAAAMPAPAAVPLYAAVEEVEAEAPPVETEAVAVTPPKPRAKPKPPVVEKQASEAPVEPEVPRPAPKPAPEPVRHTATQQFVQTTAAPAKGTPGAAVDGTRGKAGIGTTMTAGAAGSTAAGGNPGAYVDYKQLIMSWLQQHKEYPRRAKLRRQQGRARLFIAVDGRGRLLDYRVDRSSGYKLLDDEVTAMVARAQPLPAAPAGRETARYEFRFAVDFRLR